VLYLATYGGETHLVMELAGGMILPFGLGTGVASLVYNEFVDKDTVTFGNFLLFVGVAFA
jgi:hypothetical protein